MGIGDGSLGRAVFQGSPGGVFQGSCRARRDASCSPIFQLASTLLECPPILALSCFTLISLPVPRLLDIWTHTKNVSSVAREKGLGNRLQDSLPSLNERETLHTAQRVGFFVLSSGPYLCPPRSFPLSRYPTCYPSHLFSSFGGRALLVWDVPNERIPLERNWNISFIRKQILINFTRSKTKKKQNKFYNSKAVFSHEYLEILWRLIHLRVKSGDQLHLSETHSLRTFDLCFVSAATKRYVLSATTRTRHIRLIFHTRFYTRSNYNNNRPPRLVPRPRDRPVPTYAP